MSVERRCGTTAARALLKSGISGSGSAGIFRRTSYRDIRVPGKRSVDQTLSPAARRGLLRHDAMWRVRRLNLDV